LAPLGIALPHHDHELAMRYRLEDVVAAAAKPKTYTGKNLRRPSNTAATANSMYFDLINYSFINPPNYQAILILSIILL